MNGERQPLAVYVHIPFCVKKCRYCDFLSAPPLSGQMEEYLAALTREIVGKADLLRQYQAKTIFFGGGTPSLLSPAAFSELAEILKRTLAKSGSEESVIRSKEISGGKDTSVLAKSVIEWTIEANPGTITEEKADIWKKCGVNRVSVGMQSTDNEQLKKLGRIHCFQDVEEGVRILKKTGFPHLNLDLMMGLPGQTFASWKDTLEKALALEPDHLSCYSLIVEEGTDLADEVEKHPEILPDEETERAMYDWTLSRLAQEGWEHYEISNWARPGCESRHNASYWDLSDYLGLGLGASSYIHGQRLKNETDLRKYCMAEDPGSLSVVEETCSRETAMNEYMMLGFRCMKGISEKDFANRFGTSLPEEYLEILHRLKREGLVEAVSGPIHTHSATETSWRLTRRGLDLANLVFEEFV